MKLVLTDATGGEHDLDAVILGIAGDIHRLNQRLIRVEDELGINQPDAEAQETTDSEEENVGSE